MFTGDRRLFYALSREGFYCVSFTVFPGIAPLIRDKEPKRLAAGRLKATLSVGVASPPADKTRGVSFNRTDNHDPFRGLLFFIHSSASRPSVLFTNSPLSETLSNENAHFVWGDFPNASLLGRFDVEVGIFCSVIGCYL